MMKRRIALKNLATAAGGLLALPIWAHGWNTATVQTRSAFLAPHLDAVLTEIVDTIIPQTDTPGAKALNVQTFIQKMVADCYEKDVQTVFADGLKKVDETARQQHGKPFVSCNTPQRLTVLAAIEQAPETALNDFYRLVRQLTIQGFTTSEYVMTKHYNYQPIPGHYYGCVPISSR
ncbi:gluconate 2-dehydrogenase subunit 3 family protein [Larkinella arboricola]